MKGYEITKDDAAVIGLSNMAITGNVIPLQWLRQITHKNGKPNTVACILLSDIVYWYRPLEIRDESTGQFIGWRKKFKGDLLQKSYKDLAKTYGFTKRQVSENLKILQEIGLIGLHLRTIKLESGRSLSNVLFISLNVQELNLRTRGVLHSNVTPPYTVMSHPITLQCKTYTENTNTETTIQDLYSQFLSQWAELFPNKPQPRKSNKTLKKKLATRLKDSYFVENWQSALERASKSDFCKSSGWFTVAWFLKNDENWEKCFDGNYDNKPLPVAAKNGNGHHKEDDTLERIRALSAKRKAEKSQVVIDA